MYERRDPDPPWLPLLEQLPLHRREDSGPSAMLRPGRGVAISEQLGDWLHGFPWSCWATFTFDGRWGDTGPSPDRCMYHTRRWVEALPGPPVGYFLAVERGSFGRVHSHGLLSLPRGMEPTRKSLWHSWKNRFGRCRVLPYNPDLGAAYYVAKYVTKEPLHWDIGSLTIKA